MTGQRKIIWKLEDKIVLKNILKYNFLFIIKVLNETKIKNYSKHDKI